MNKKNWWKY